ncbi:MAG: hypothetical protein AAF692_04320 [Pseudomonadota bacterium]
MAFAIGFDGPDGEIGVVMFGLILPLLAIAPIASHLLANRKADEHLEKIVAHLSEVADFERQ